MSDRTGTLQCTESLLLALDSYVRNGGHLITTFRSGFSDEYLKIYPTCSHISCMNVWDFTTISLHTRIMWISCGSKRCHGGCTEAFFTSGRLCLFLTSSACEWMELITCDTAVPVLKYSHPAYERYAAAAKINMEMVPHFILERCLKMMNC